MSVLDAAMAAVVAGLRGAVVSGPLRPSQPRPDSGGGNAIALPSPAPTSARLTEGRGHICSANTPLAVKRHYSLFGMAGELKRCICALQFAFARHTAARLNATMGRGCV